MRNPRVPRIVPTIITKRYSLLVTLTTNDTPIINTIAANAEHLQNSYNYEAIVLCPLSSHFLVQFFFRFGVIIGHITTIAFSFVFVVAFLTVR